MVANATKVAVRIDGLIRKGGWECDDIDEKSRGDRVPILQKKNR